MRKRPTRAQKPTYTYLGFRPPKQLQERVDALCAKTGRRKSALMVECLLAGLPKLEKQAEAK